MVRPRLSEKQIFAQLEVAQERAQEADRNQPRAVRAWYDATEGRIMIELTDHVLFGFPARLGQGLAGATPDQLAEVKLGPGGRTLRWESLDADLLIPQLVLGVFGSRSWMSELGRAGGSVRSEAKATAARANGARGGRPSKREVDEDIYAQMPADEARESEASTWTEALLTDVADEAR